MNATASDPDIGATASASPPGDSQETGRPPVRAIDGLPPVSGSEAVSVLNDLRDTVYEADSAWAADLDDADLRRAYKAAKKAYREVEKAAIARGATTDCGRCGGAGGWQGWPGYVCFRCHGSTQEPLRTHKFQAEPPTRAKREAEAQAATDELDRVYREQIAALGEVGQALEAARLAQAHDDYEANREINFRASLASKLFRFGSLTEAQVAAVERGLEREVVAAARPALGEGLQTLTGKVVSCKWQESRFGTTPKMLVELDDGNRVWGTIPQAVFDSNDGYNMDSLPGQRVTLTATVERSSDDEHFGFFKRPTNAAVTS